ncbi:MAG: hypothetical protein AAF907_01205, partial [Planctomycetota bacterium]
MLARQLSAGKADQFQADYNAARLRIPAVRAALAETKSGEEKTEEYVKAEKELLSWLTLTDPARITDAERRDAEDLYEQLQKGRGVAVPQPLPSPGADSADETQIADAGEAGAGKQANPGAAGAGNKAGESTDENDGPNVVLAAIGVGVFALLTVGAIIAFKPKPRKRAARRRTASAGEAGGKSKNKRRASRGALPERAPIPAAAPVAADAGPVGT